MRTVYYSSSTERSFRASLRFLKRLLVLFLPAECFPSILHLAFHKGCIVVNMFQAFRPGRVHTKIRMYRGQRSHHADTLICLSMTQHRVLSHVGPGHFSRSVTSSPLSATMTRYGVRRNNCPSENRQRGTFPLC